MATRNVVLLLALLHLPSFAWCQPDYCASLPNDPVAIRARMNDELAAAEANAVHHYYCSPDGSDTTGNGSIGDPWKLPQAAVPRIRAGDVLYLRAGTYVSTKYIPFNQSGTSPDKRVVMRNYPGEAVTIDMGTNIPTWVGTKVGINLNAGWVFIYGLNLVDGGGGYTISSPAGDTRIVNCTFGNNAKQDCIKGLNPSAAHPHMLVVDCKCADTSRQFVDSFKDYTIVSGCTVNKPNPLNVGGQASAIYFKGGVIGCRLIGCHITVGSPGSRGNWANPAIFVGGMSAHNTKVRRGFEAQSCGVYGCTIISYHQPALTFRDANTCEAVGNVIYQFGSETAIDVYGNTDTPKFVTTINRAYQPPEDYHDSVSIALRGNTIHGGGSVRGGTSPIWLRIVLGSTGGFAADYDSIIPGTLVALWNVPPAATTAQNQAAQRTISQLAAMGLETHGARP